MKNVLRGVLLLGLLLPFISFAQVLPVSKQPILWLQAESLNLHDSVLKDIRTDSIWIGSAISDIDSFGNYNFHKSLNFQNQIVPFKANIDPKTSQSITLYTVYRMATNHVERGVWEITLNDSTNSFLSDRELVTPSFSISYPPNNPLTPIVNMTKINWREKSIDSLWSGFYFLGANNNPFDGELAEVILFSDPLTELENNWIHTYLCIKYGVTLSYLDYIASDTTVVWDNEIDSVYSNDVAGIANDTNLLIHQKQAAGNGGKDIITFSVGDFHAHNSTHQASLPNKSYWIWGHNGEDISFDLDTLQDPNVYSNRLHRNWKLKVNEHVGVTPINLRVWLDDVNTLDSQSVFLLVDRGVGDFNALSTEVFAPDSIDTLGNLYFLNLVWDIDNSGEDYFTLMTTVPLTGEGRTEFENDSLHELQPEHIKIFPNPSTGIFQIEIETPIHIQQLNFRLFDSSGKISQSGVAINRSITDNSFRIEHFISGTYTLEIEFYGEKISKTLIIQK